MFQAEIDPDNRVRLAAFAYLAQQVQLRGEVLPWKVLLAGFRFEGSLVPLVAPQGIFKPAILTRVPLTIRTAAVEEGASRPYEDGIGPGGVLYYRYRGTDPAHPDNVGLRAAMQLGAPLIYFLGVIPGQYLPVWPVYIVSDNPAQLCFSVAVDAAEGATAVHEVHVDAGLEARRQYITTMTQRRLHQVSFRQRVLRAYQEKCAICRLRHVELLEAAHILPDGHPLGEPTVSNGLALCKLHHAAFDRHILGIRPDLVVQVRTDILEEVDGPMLKHGLQGFQDKRILTPRNKDLHPKREHLEERYALFLRAA